MERHKGREGGGGEVDRSPGKDETYVRGLPRTWDRMHEKAAAVQVHGGANFLFNQRGQNRKSEKEKKDVPAILNQSTQTLTLSFPPSLSPSPLLSPLSF